MKRLPGSPEQLAGLRAAHWGRESSGRQADRFGPEAQRHQRAEAIRRLGLVDTGITWMVSHSGRTVAGTRQWAEMIARAGRDYDVLIVGYVSRFARNVRAAINAAHELEQRGAVLHFADERILPPTTARGKRWSARSSRPRRTAAGSRSVSGKATTPSGGSSRTWAAG